jgi:hypothetical protein
MAGERFMRPEVNMSKDRIIAVGFLTAADLKNLGSGFHRHFLVDHDEIFADLLEKLDSFEATPLGEGVTIQPRRQDR